MNKPKVKDIKSILKSEETKDYCFNNEDYWALVKNLYVLGMDQNDLRYDLKRGLYGKINASDLKLEISDANGKINIWVNKNIPRGYIRVYPKDKIPQTNLDSGWSIDIKITEFKKMIKLKAFW